MTAATATAAGRPDPPAGDDREPIWRWPIEVRRYDRAAALTLDEAAALRALGQEVRRWRPPPGSTPPPDGSAAAAWQALDRLVRPLAAALAALDLITASQREGGAVAVALLLYHCGSQGQSFWGWSAATWERLLGRTQAAYLAAHPAWVNREARHGLIAIAYLLGCWTDLPALGEFQRVALAGKVFGHARLGGTLAAVHAVLVRWGYRGLAPSSAGASLLCDALLANASPRLADLSAAVLARCGASRPERRALVFQLQRALAALGIMAAPTLATTAPAAPEGVDPAWAQWVERWEAASPLAPSTRQHVRGGVLKAGRWLAAAHPEAREPAMWTRELCAAYVAAVDRMHVGDYAQRHASLRERLGRPLSARAKAAYLGELRQFFRDCQEWEWIPVRFDPARALATPRSVKALIGPNPRVLADDVWAKLLWAGLQLEAADLPVQRGGGRCYPIELVRALTLAWLFSGLRSDEIARLRVGCVRWQRLGDTAEPAESAPTPDATPDAVCLLDVPVHKTGTAFTKPVDPLLGRAIAAWEAVRPAQPPLLDRKTGEAVALLFCYRAKPVAKTYLNQAVIPALCRKAGVPSADARGPITSHRARSTIASQLYNAKDPMTLFELQAWLGHRSPATTQHYARITPTTLAKAYRDADYFARNVRTIEVLLDRAAVQSGAAADGAPWQYVDLGHGYCTYSFFEQCPHRMACARCDFYVPKASARAQLLEAKTGLQRMLATITLTEDERAAVEDDAAAVARLLDRLADAPTPAGPTPRALRQRGGIPLPVLAPPPQEPPP